MAEISIIHSVLTINNHEVGGYADEDGALSLPDSELYNVRRGPTGETVYSYNGMRGGELELRLLPTSPSAVFFIRMGQQIKNGSRIRVDGDYSNLSLGYSVKFRNGVLKSLPPGPTLGSTGAGNLTFMFDFESIISDFDDFRQDTGLIPTQAGVL